MNGAQLSMTNTNPRFETLIEQHHDEIYAYLWRLLDTASRADPAAEAGDLTQEVFLRAYRAYRRLRPGSNTRAWLYKIATNCAYNLFKKRRIGSMTLLDEMDEPIEEAALLPETQVMFRESVAAVRAAIAALPSGQKSALIMRYVQELAYQEIAAALGCSEDSARANVYQAVKKLRSNLGESDNE